MEIVGDEGSEGGKSREEGDGEVEEQVIDSESAAVEGGEETEGEKEKQQEEGDEKEKGDTDMEVVETEDKQDDKGDGTDKEGESCMEVDGESEEVDKGDEKEREGEKSPEGEKEAEIEEEKGSEKESEEKSEGEEKQEKIVGEEDEKEDDEEKKDEKEDEEDEEAPKIFLRPFSEITERQSDEDEDDDEVVFVGEEKKSVEEEQKRKRREEEEERNRKRREEEERIRRVRERLEQISTRDETGMGLDMSCGEAEEKEKREQSVPGWKESAGGILCKMDLWLQRKLTSVSLKPTVQQQVVQVPAPAQQQQQVRQVFVPQQQQQQSGTQVGRVLWQQQGQGPLQAQQIQNVMKTTAGAVLQQQTQQQFPQLLFDPNTGLFFSPSASGGHQVIQQPAQSQHQQIRFQNVLLPQAPVSRYGQQQARQPLPITVSQPSASRAVLTHRLNAAPMVPSVPRGLLQQQQPLQPRMLNPRHQMTASRQYQAARQQTQVQSAIRPVQQVRPQVQSTPPPRLNGVVPVRLPIGQASIVPQGQGAAKSGITAGNQKPIPGTVEENEQDLQNKTYPSLVVTVKTCLGSKGSKQVQGKARSELDSNVKSILMNTPAQFTEYLMRKGLLKLDHTCEAHSQAMKLGMYSDTNRQPFSGGYVWTSDCCPEKQSSVFSDSIFEGSKYPPGTVFKLIYHWACQTPANNVLQWVKVSSFYLKNFFTLLRAVCIGWLHEMCPPLGGESRYVEVGVITLGSSAETSRGVKNVNVEILGVFDPLSKIMRMKVINSMNGLIKDKNASSSSKQTRPDSTEQGARAFQILWPLTHWVDKRSTLLVDGIIDKALFHELGFKNIQQCGAAAGGAAGTATNTNVMNYLRNLVPKMFSSTLSVLSKSIVQQFLDELSWREIHGQSVLLAYENMLSHISQMTTKWEGNTQPLIPRLNKINQNPFIDWSSTKQTRRCPLNTIPFSLRNEPGIRECIKYVKKEDANKKPASGSAVPAAIVQNGTGSSGTSHQNGVKVAVKRKGEDVREQKISSVNVQYYKTAYRNSLKDACLQTFYYGRKVGGNVAAPPVEWVPGSVKCPLCVKTFTSKSEIPRHLYSHACPPPNALLKGPSAENSICNICLKQVPAGVTLVQHVSQTHRLIGFKYSCKICEIKFQNEEDLTIHMWDLHNKRETPYKCGVCGFASAVNYDVYEHFLQSHSSYPQVPCPLCLKPFIVTSTASLRALILHYQSHDSRRSRKCPRCTLHFPTETDLDNHLLYHFPTQEASNWSPLPIPVEESSIPMCSTPPLTRTPIPSSMSNTLSYFSASQPPPTPVTGPPPPKKQKVQGPPKPVETKKSTLNVTIAVPIDTNEKFGGSRYKINLPDGIVELVEVDDEEGGAARVSKESLGVVMCGECDGEVKPGHFIGRLVCTKCRYITSCQSAMDIHHTRNHQPDSKQIKPVIKTNPIRMLEEELICKCGYASVNPYKLATHLTQCETVTAYPKQKQTDKQPEATCPEQPEPDKPKGSETAAPGTVESSAARPVSPVKPIQHGSFDLLGPEPVPTFEDMLTLDASMSSGLENSAFGMAPLLSPSGGGRVEGTGGGSGSTFIEPQTPCPGGGGSGGGSQLGEWENWDGCLSSFIK